MTMLLRMTSRATNWRSFHEIFFCSLKLRGLSFRGCRMFICSSALKLTMFKNKSAGYSFVLCDDFCNFMAGREIRKTCNESLVAFYVIFFWNFSAFFPENNFLQKGTNIAKVYSSLKFRHTVLVKLWKTIEKVYAFISKKKKQNRTTQTL